ncbi:hypothetical protein BN946_scf184998.g15 [Trametes cinnabarina]|uniref:Uncharacterized protein n=1 Tax=Pycnoporus cinnabarinus TaxID=5643 RepID=A0A060S7Z8_PYCCI|nr:hypothetical protein BN946_scf184998.g15 [Trametes cinnabarina]
MAPLTRRSTVAIATSAVPATTTRTVQQLSVDESAPFDAGASNVRYRVQNLGIPLNYLPREIGILKRVDLEKEDLVTLKRWCKLLMVPYHKSRSQILDNIFANRTVVPYLPRRHRSLRIAATEKGIVLRHGIDKGLARPALKIIQGYNPHKDEIAAKAREEMGPQSPVPTEVGSPPPSVAELPQPEHATRSTARCSCPLDKGKGVDRSRVEDETVVQSPYPRPTRVPFGQLRPADFSRNHRFEEPDTSSDPSYEYEDTDQDAVHRQDTGLRYAYPPREPDDPSWLSNMRWGIEEDATHLDLSVQGVRDWIHGLCVEGNLAEAEALEVEGMYKLLSQHIAHVAGKDVMQKIIQRAKEIELPPFEVDDYTEHAPRFVPAEEHCDPQAQAEAEAEAETAAAREQMVMDNSRPSDTLSYLDRSSLPPTSPLAFAATRFRGRRRQRALSPAAEDETNGSPRPSKRMRLNSHDRDSFEPSHSPSRGESPEIPYNLGTNERNIEATRDNTGEPASPLSSYHSDEEGNDRAGLAKAANVAANTDPISPSGYQPPSQSVAVPRDYSAPSTPRRDGYDSDSDVHSDLVSPLAPPPPGWPYKMPRSFWEREEWREAFLELKAEREAKKLQEKEEELRQLEAPEGEASGSNEEDSRLDGSDAGDQGMAVDIPTGEEKDHVSDSGMDDAEQYDADVDMGNDATLAGKVAKESASSEISTDAVNAATSNHGAAETSTLAAAPVTPPRRRSARLSARAARGAVPTYVTPRDFNGRTIRRRGRNDPVFESRGRSPPIS